MEASRSPSCCLCARLLHKAGERRVLRSPATSHISNAIKHVAAELFPGSVDVLFPSNAYLCKVCVRSVEKLLRLRENLKKEEQDFRARLTSVGEKKGLSASSHFQPDEGQSSGKLPELLLVTARFHVRNSTFVGTASVQLTPRKATASTGVETPSPKRRRTLQDTPTRRALQQVAAVDSPVVSVRIHV